MAEPSEPPTPIDQVEFDSATSVDLATDFAQALAEMMKDHIIVLDMIRHIPIGEDDIEEGDIREALLVTTL